MAQYSRAFITLKQDRSGYGLKSREPSGRAVIEVKNGKGKITVSVQELKGEVGYRAYIVSSTNDCVAVKIGSLRADERGKAELKWEFDPFDVERTGIQIEAFDVVAVVVQSQGENAWVLTGYRGDTVRFKEKFHEAVTREKAVVESQQEPPQEPTVAEIQSEPEPVECLDEPQIEEAQTEKVQTDEPDDESGFEPLVMFTEEEAEVAAASEPEEAPEDVKTQSEPEPQPDPHAKFKSMAQRFNKELEELETLMHESTDARQKHRPDAMKTIMENNAAMVPFKSGLEDVKWVRISLKDLAHLPRNCWKLSYDPYINFVFSKYKHLMLGAYDDQPRYILALPDAFDASRERHAKQLGFDLFKPSDNVIEEHRDAEYGYWLMEFEL
ncbi:MAG: hypothetical protein FWE68_00570 [Defluviitaleaceae bacterium]|nr:hypothetical protein [Defluviitaleaceae bacterium]